MVAAFAIIFAAVVFFAPEGAVLSRVQQLFPGRSAQDAATYCTGVVFHAVLLDFARRCVADFRYRCQILGGSCHGGIGDDHRFAASLGSQPGEVDTLSRADLQGGFVDF